MEYMSALKPRDQIVLLACLQLHQLVKCDCLHCATRWSCILLLPAALGTGEGRAGRGAKLQGDRATHHTQTHSTHQTEKSDN